MEIGSKAGFRVIMDPAVKWIGGASVAVALALGAAVLAGGAMEDREAVDPREWAASDDVLAAPPAPAPAAAAAGPAPAATDAPLLIKRVLPIQGPIRYGEWHWDDEGVPDGPLVMTVDLDARVISVFRDGYEIGAAAVLLGTQEHPTPLGTFPILTKERHNVSEKYDNAPMPWTLRLTWDGVAIHGGSSVENGYASHGCIAGPDEFVSRLFDIARVGDQVIITRGQNASVGTPLAQS